MNASVVRQSILDCTRCELRLRCTKPVPFTGQTPADIAVVGEAPGKEEDRVGEPFIGPSGKMLWKALGEVGIERRHCFVCNSVSCYPHGAPPADAIEACRINLQNQLRVARPNFILIVGGVALRAFGKDGITQIHGQYWEKYVGTHRVAYFPIYHPAYVMRNKLVTRAWKDDIAHFAELVGTK